MFHPNTIFKRNDIGTSIQNNSKRQLIHQEEDKLDGSVSTYNYWNESQCSSVVYDNQYRKIIKDLEKSQKILIKEIERLTSLDNEKTEKIKKMEKKLEKLERSYQNKIRE
jgi:hypothetical protein